jgi:hypothetical protein
MPLFPKWLSIDIEERKQHGIAISDDVDDTSRPLSLQAMRFKSMYAYGYHFWVKSEEESITKTCDSGIAAFFRRPCRFGRHDDNLVDANLEEIGQILEMVELNYGRHCTVLLVCDRVKANYRRRSATVRKDEWGLTVANFNTIVPYAYEYFAFPVYCDQFIFQMKRPS